MQTTILILIQLAVFLVSATAQTIPAKKLIGTWRLVSWLDVTDQGTPTSSHGIHPKGFLTYTSDGRMSAILTNEGRKLLTNPRWNLAPAVEQAEAYASSTAYAGTYSVQGPRVIHHVEVSTIPNYVDTDLVRVISRLDGNRMTLRTTTSFVGTDGVQYAYQELVWDRVR